MKKGYQAILLTWMFVLLSGMNLQAQNAKLQGTVSNNQGETLIGATVLFQGTARGSVTNVDGQYLIDAIEPGTYKIVYSFLGNTSKIETVTFTAGQPLTKDIVLESDAMMLKEAVVVGYGTSKKEDLTGSTVVVTSKDFGKGNITTPEQLVSGKVSGIQITSNDGAPGSGSSIRIRGGTSINASNDPLIVIDGVPLDNGTISGAGNPLSLINPQDIESFVILKDASAAAIYGSRGANGVILITTKRGKAGSKDVIVNLQTSYSISEIVQYANVLSADEYRDVINQYGTNTQINRLGTESTDWQKEIYQRGTILENNLSFSGGLQNLPYRVSIGYKSEEGILKRSKLDRTSLGMNFNPSLFDDKLKIEINTKFAYTKNFFPDRGAIGGAVSFDPTKPVFRDDLFVVGGEETTYGGYYEWTNTAGALNNLAGKNPVGLLNQRDDESRVNRFIGNIKLDYEIPLIEALHAVLNLGTDAASSNGFVQVPAEAASQFAQKGQNTVYEQKKENKLLEFYLNYNKDLETFESNLDLTGGYSYQRWNNFSPAQPSVNALNDTITPAGIPALSENALISFYGRLKYDMFGKYLITATIRNDGSSRFSPDNRWGLFPSVAVAWRISEENIFKDSDVLSYLKMRAGYGITGQQDIFNDYPYIANYNTSSSTAQYQFGGNFYTLLRPDGYDSNIKWEETTSINGGLDFGFVNDRIFGSIDVYKKETNDLLAVVDVVAGTNFTNEILTNVGSMENTGIELELSFVPVDTKNVDFTFGVNVTSNQNKVTKLSKVANPDSPGILVGGISGGIGNNVQIHSVGHPVFSFFVYEQVYDDNGKPVQGEFVDRNGDDIINEKDRYIYEKPSPDLFAGFYTNFRYKKWSTGFNIRAEFDRYIYNNVNSNRGNFQSVGTSSLSNLNQNFLETEFLNTSVKQYLSDYYVEKANFFRMDYLNLSYNFGKLLKNTLDITLGVNVNNVFVISDYSGIDPEVVGGIDNNIFPRPRVYSLSLNVTL